MEVNFLDYDLEKFITNLQKQTIAKVLRTIDLLEQFGHKLGPPHTKKVQTNLYELRIKGKIEVRIFYTFYKNNIVLVHGFIKKTQRIPEKELKKAVKKIKELDSL